MKTHIFILLFFAIANTTFAQKLTKEEKETLKEYRFTEGFLLPSVDKTSKVILEDGTEIEGYVDKVDVTKHYFIIGLTFQESKDSKPVEIPLATIKETFFYGSDLDKAANITSLFSRAGKGRRNNMDDVTEDGPLNYIKVQIPERGQKDSKELTTLLQLINPDFNNFISVYYDPLSKEGDGGSISLNKIGSMNLKSGVLQSYYVQKDGEITLLFPRNFKQNYTKLFGDSKEFMEKFPYKSNSWKRLSGLIYFYNQMKNEEQGITTI